MPQVANQQADRLCHTRGLIRLQACVRTFKPLGVLQAH
jgi:hypothetical protein